MNMPTILETLNDDMKTAMRAHESDRLSTIRFVISALKNAKIEAMHDLSDDESIAVLRKQAKMRRDSIEQYRKGNREDLASKEEAELAVIESYLPAAPSGENVRDAVKAAIVSTKATSVGDMSSVMKTAMGILGSTVDGRQVQGIVREELAALGS